MFFLESLKLVLVYFKLVSPVAQVTITTFWRLIFVPVTVVSLSFFFIFYFFRAEKLHFAAVRIITG
jgi:hypothetical protein